MPGVGSRGGIGTQDGVSAGMCERKEPSETPRDGTRRTSVLSMTHSYFRRMRFATKVLGPPRSHTRRASASQVPPNFLPLPLGPLRLLFPVPFPCSSKEWEYWWRYLHGLMPCMSPSSPLGHREAKMCFSLPSWSCDSSWGDVGQDQSLSSRSLFAANAISEGSAQPGLRGPLKTLLSHS